MVVNALLKGLAPLPPVKNYKGLHYYMQHYLNIFKWTAKVVPFSHELVLLASCAGQARRLLGYLCADSIS